MNLLSSMRELLSFSLSFVGLADGGAGLSSPAAWADGSRGTAISAIANVASTKSLIANLLMRISPWGNPIPTPADLNTLRYRSFPGHGLYLKGGGTLCTTCRPEHDEHVIQMNEVRHFASGWVQRPAARVACMISEPGHPTCHLSSPLLKEETTMLKTISAALLAVSMLAAPAMAAGSGKTTQAPAAKATQVKPSVLNANAKMGRHHVKHVRHHRAPKKMSAHKAHQVSKATIRHVAPATNPGCR